MNPNEAKQRAYEEQRSKIRICGMAHPKKEELVTFRVTAQDGTTITVGTTAAGLMDRYGPATGAVRWELESVAGGFY